MKGPDEKLQEYVALGNRLISSIGRRVMDLHLPVSVQIGDMRHTPAQVSITVKVMNYGIIMIVFKPFTRWSNKVNADVWTGHAHVTCAPIAYSKIVNEVGGEISEQAIIEHVVYIIPELIRHIDYERARRSRREAIEEQLTRLAGHIADVSFPGVAVEAGEEGATIKIALTFEGVQPRDVLTILSDMKRRVNFASDLIARRSAAMDPARE